MQLRVGPLRSKKLKQGSEGTSFIRAQERISILRLRFLIKKTDNHLIEVTYFLGKFVFYWGGGY